MNKTVKEMTSNEQIKQYYEYIYKLENLAIKNRLITSMNN